MSRQSTTTTQLIDGPDVLLTRGVSDLFVRRVCPPCTHVYFFQIYDMFNFLIKMRQDDAHKMRRMRHVN